MVILTILYIYIFFGEDNLSRKCDICGKKPIFGSNISHSKRHTNRRWLPNIHKTTITLGGLTQRVKICTRCLRTINKPAV